MTKKKLILLLLLVAPLTLGVVDGNGAPTTPDLTGVWSLRVWGYERGTDGDRDYFRGRSYLVIEQFDGEARLYLEGDIFLAGTVGDKYLIGSCNEALLFGQVTMLLNARITRGGEGLRGRLLVFENRSLDVIRFEATRLSDELPDIDDGGMW